MLVKFKVINGIYLMFFSDDDVLSLLGLFLTGDIVNDTSYYKNWVLNFSSKGYGGNTCDLEKVNGNIILRYTEAFNDDIEFVITIEKFVEILDTWEQLIKEKPQEIFMTREGNEIILFGVGK